MTKTKQIGVRFNKELLDSTGLSPQKALRLYESSFGESGIDLYKVQKPKEKFSVITDNTGKEKINDALVKYGKSELSTLVNSNPKNLQEVKDLCPKELIGMDRSNWISENRKKYNL